MGKQYTLFDESSPAAGAEFSECGRYRYKLWRKWDENKPIAMCIGLNPSTANFSKDDPTIGTLKRILTNLGYGGFYMMNLFALISSKPSALLKCEDPIGDNDTKLKEVEKLCDDVIVCWGGILNKLKIVLLKCCPIILMQNVLEQIKMVLRVTRWL